MTASIFFAYEGGHQDNINAISAGIKEFNKHQSTYSASTWEEMSIVGMPINSEIFKCIDECEIFSCDLTYLNHNVLFELGYAIGKRRRIIIFLNNTVVDAEKNYRSLKFLRNVGYSVFINGKDVLRGLQVKDSAKENILDELVRIDSCEKNVVDVFLINNKIENQASLDVKDSIKKIKKYNIIVNDTSEVEYKSLVWYLNTIIKSKSVVLHMLGTDKVGNHENNAEFSFYAGLACGLDKKVLLIAPGPFVAPIDYTDILMEYDTAEECVSKTRDWIEKNVKIEGARITSTEDEDISLLKLGIGIEIAEEEESSLIDYYVEIDPYRRALRRKSAFFIGRKGVGKSALFIKLKHDLEQDGDIITVPLKPESEELLENVDLARLFTGDVSKGRFLSCVWMFVIYSKILLSIEKNNRGKMLNYPESSVEYRLGKYVSDNRALLESNFYSAVEFIWKKYFVATDITTPQFLEAFHKEVLAGIKKILGEYFNKNKYTKIFVLADNLDKTWDANNDLTLQVLMILSLLETSGKIKDDLKISEINISTMLFLRKDIFNLILKKSREPDKLIAKSMEINWNNYPEKLRAIVEKRIRYVLSLDDDSSVVNVWDTYFKFKNIKTKDPYAYIEKHIVKRPRDIIYFMSSLFESAINKDKKVIDDEDIEYAIEQYASFLNQNLIAELKAQYPRIEDVLYDVKRKSPFHIIKYNEFVKILRNNDMTNYEINELIEILFRNEYMLVVFKKGLFGQTEGTTDYNKFNELTSGFWGRKNPDVYLNPHMINLKMGQNLL
jgi:hypothetical protein